ncbi:MAG: hypothetical protein IMY73_02700 [Bacteroidetes bacterium]|nr:hypothetical protein [Bacteroidota bacterium]
MKKLFSLLCLFMALSFAQSCSKDKEPNVDPDKPRVLEDDKAVIKSTLMDMVKMMETYPTGIYSDVMSILKEDITYTPKATEENPNPEEKTKAFPSYIYKNLTDSIGKYSYGTHGIDIIDEKDGVTQLNFDLLKGNYNFDNTKKEFIRTENTNAFVTKFPANAKGTVESDNIYNLTFSEYSDKEVTLFLATENDTKSNELKAKLPTKIKAEITKSDVKIANLNLESIDYTLRGVPTKIKGSIYAKPFTLNVDINRSQETLYDIKLDLASEVKADKKLSATLKLELSSAINDFEIISKNPEQVLASLKSLNIDLSYDKLSVKGDIKDIPSILAWVAKKGSPIEELNNYADLAIYLEDFKIGDVTASIVDEKLVINVKYYDESSENISNLYQESLLEMVKMVTDIVVDINSLKK